MTKPRAKLEDRATTFGEVDQDRYRLLVDDLLATEATTYAEVARRLGIRQDHLTRVRQGKRRVSLEGRRRAATALEISEKYFTDEAYRPWREYRASVAGDVVVDRPDPAWLADEVRAVYAALAAGLRPIEEGYKLALLVSRVPAFHHAQRVIEGHEHARRRGEAPGPHYDLAVQHLAVAVRELFASASDKPTKSKAT